uniref:Uncharacterized protein n=1 Tax=Rhizophora mucronata TaxID=61149 RepID=A0A2P2IIU9_RHIMU
MFTYKKSNLGDLTSMKISMSQLSVGKANFFFRKHDSCKQN